MASVLNSQLIEAARSGDPEALRVLIEATQSRLYRFCLILCGDPVRAEDLCQDAYVKTFDSLKNLKEPNAFIDWLFRLTRNLYIDGVRKAREQVELSEDDVSIHGELAEPLAVHQILSQFDPEDRWLLLLVDMEGYSYGEAAKWLGISEDAVRSRLFRLRKEFLRKWQGRETI
jgi:RNA polymerase sigma-70 factor (ECF subfamily)